MAPVVQPLYGRPYGCVTNVTLVSREYRCRLYSGSEFCTFSLTQMQGDRDFDGVAETLIKNGEPKNRNHPYWGLRIEGQNMADKQHSPYSDLSVKSFREILELFPSVSFVELCHVHLVPSFEQDNFTILTRSRKLKTLVLDEVTTAIHMMDGRGSHLGLHEFLQLFDTIEELVVDNGFTARDTVNSSDIDLCTLATQGIEATRPRIAKVIMQRNLCARLFYAVLQRPCVVSDITSLRLAVPKAKTTSWTLLRGVLNAACKLEDLALDITPCFVARTMNDYPNYADIVSPLRDCLRQKSTWKKFTMSIPISYNDGTADRYVNDRSWGCFVEFISTCLGPKVDFVAVEFVHAGQRDSSLEPFFRARNWADFRAVLMGATELKVLNFSACNFCGTGMDGGPIQLTRNDQNYLCAQLPQDRVYIFLDNATLLSSVMAWKQGSTSR